MVLGIFYSSLIKELLRWLLKTYQFWSYENYEAKKKNYLWQKCLSVTYISNIFYKAKHIWNVSLSQTNYKQTPVYTVPIARKQSMFWFKSSKKLFWIFEIESHYADQLVLHLLCSPSWPETLGNTPAQPPKFW